VTGWLIGAVAALAAAVTALADPALESRAQALEKEIRCVQCENEPISQSTAPVAVDMRQFVRERILAGDSDDQIRSFFKDRYGEGVLLRPDFEAGTLGLWLAPLALALVAGAAVWRWRANAAKSAGGPFAPVEPEDGER
jgi:cytochrome c-type biogenesis protein CcmH